MNALTQYFTRRRKSLYVAVGLVMAVLIGTGGALAGAALSSGSSGPAGSSATAATLNAAVSSTSPATTPASKAHKVSALSRLRRLGGMYGEVAYHGKAGTKTLAFERGTVTSAGGDLVVKAANGTTWTWTYASDTTVRKAGQKASRSDLASGQRVLVAGQVVSGKRDVRVVIVAGTKGNKAKTGTPAPTPSSPSGTTSS